MKHSKLILIFTLFCWINTSYSQEASIPIQTIKDLVIGVAKAYNNVDTTMIKDLFISKKQYIRMIEKQWEEQPTRSLPGQDPRQVAIDDYNMRLGSSTMMFFMDAMKYKTFNIMIDTEQPVYEAIDFPEEVNMKLLLIHLKHEKYKFLLFMGVRTETGWYLVAPVWRTTEERPDLSDSK